VVIRVLHRGCLFVGLRFDHRDIVLLFLSCHVDGLSLVVVDCVNGVLVVRIALGHGDVRELESQRRDLGVGSHLDGEV
jgi:hypothetical protein